MKSYIADIGSAFVMAAFADILFENMMISMLFVGIVCWMVAATNRFLL